MGKEAWNEIELDTVTSLEDIAVTGKEHLEEEVDG